MRAKALEQIEVIKAALKEFGAPGASVEEIQATISMAIPRRTLQRRLEEMQQKRIVRTTGEARSTRYHLVVEASNQLEDIGKTKLALPLSEESKKVLSLVSRPNEERTPVGYHWEFLELYQPNVTKYLTTGEIDKLFQLGRIPSSSQIAGTYAKNILQRLLVDLSYNSSRLEGNTYSLLDTERLIKLGEAADDKSAVEAQMILNHKDAIEFLVNSADTIEINRYAVLNLHALLANNLLDDPAAPGRLRTFEVGIGNSVYTPLVMPQLIEEMFELMLEKARQITNPFEKAFFIMVHLPYLQPFEDVNKRVSRLAANIPLNQHNLAPLSFVDVPEEIYVRGLLAVYELNRVELLKDVFLWAYERSAARYAAVRQTLGKPDLFKMKYRQEISRFVSKIVSSGMAKKAADDFIKANAEIIPENDRTKFIEYVETELLSLHEGSFARYYIAPPEFTRWKEAWDNS
jgi:hypothetical protein